MKLLPSLFVMLSTFVLIKKCSGDRREFQIQIDMFRAEPFPLIKTEKNYMIPAMPEKFDRSKDIYTYYYEDSKEEFKIACVASTRKEKKSQREWNKKKDIVSKNASVLFAKSIPTDGSKVFCKRYPNPTIRATEESCNHSDDKFYEVGYPVSTDETIENVQFITIYRMCYSTRKGTLYSVHHILSPSTLLQEVIKFYQMTPSFSTKLNRISKKKLKELGRKYLRYELVGLYDMPTEYYNRTTFFVFNLVPISKSRYVLQNMITIDNYVRLFSKETEKFLTLYSGTYEYEITFTKTFTTWGRKKERHEQQRFRIFWRIITDAENKAVIIITQYIPTNICDESKFICTEGVVVLKKDENNGICSYKCLVNEKIITLLGLPSSLKFSGYLQLTFTPKHSEKQDVQPPVQGGLVAYPPTTNEPTVDILDFMLATNFMATLMMFDSALAQSVYTDMPLTEGAYSGGGGSDFIGSMGFGGSGGGGGLGELLCFL